MKEAKFSIETTEHRHPSGRVYLEYKPVFTPDICAQGSLSFAVWQVWKDEPWTFSEGKRKAVESAAKTMRMFAARCTNLATV